MSQFVRKAGAKYISQSCKAAVRHDDLKAPSQGLFVGLP
ncbi:MAG: hypothetical protein ACJAZ1_003330 [Yoonia sp.]|jgi:hypothetical protein